MQPTPAISYRKEYRPTFYQQPRAHTCKRGGLALFEWSRHFQILLHALRFRGEYDKQFCNSYIMRFRYCIDRQSILWFILDYVPPLSRDLKLLSEIVCLRHILIHLIAKWVDCAGRSGGLIHMMTFFCFGISTLCISLYPQYQLKTGKQYTGRPGRVWRSHTAMSSTRPPACC